MYLKMIVLFLAVSLAVTSAGIPGGVADADIKDADVQKALRFAVAQYNKQSNEAFVRKVTRVIRVQQQVSTSNLYSVCNHLNWEHRWIKPSDQVPPKTLS